MNPQPEKQINIELGESEAEGTYSNLVLISHSPAEFVMDFTRVLPGKPKAKVYSRIIMAPQHAKSLLRALEENVKKYEAEFGEVKVYGMPGKEKNIGFQE
jgi:isocitrate dehydrogenase kinase/phosphatase